MKSHCIFQFFTSTNLFLHSHQSFAVNDTCIMPSAFAPDFVLHHLLFPPIPLPTPSRSVVGVGVCGCVCVCGGGYFCLFNGWHCYGTRLCYFILYNFTVCIWFGICISFSGMYIYQFICASKWTLYKFPRHHSLALSLLHWSKHTKGSKERHALGQEHNCKLLG